MTFPPQQPGPGDMGQQPYGGQPDPYAQQQFAPTSPAPAAGQLPPPGMPPMMGQPPAAAQPSKAPWIVAGITSLIAVGSIVASLVIVSGDDSGGGGEKNAEPSKSEAEMAYVMTEDLCGDLDESTYDSLIEPDDGLDTSFSGLNEVECRGYEDSDDFNSLSIVAASHEDTGEAEKSYERRKGEVGVDTSEAEDAEGDWDQAEIMSQDEYGAGIIVQDKNLDLIVVLDMEGGKGSEMEEVVTAIAQDVLKITKAG